MPSLQSSPPRESHSESGPSQKACRAPHAPAQRRPYFLREPWQTTPNQTQSPTQTQTAKRTSSSLHAPHPLAKRQPDPRRDRRIHRRPQQSQPERQPRIRLEEVPHPVETLRPRVVVEVNRPEESVLARLRQ